MKLIDNKIYLASKSPRRRDLLRQIGVQFELLLLRDSPDRPIDVAEDSLPNELPLDYVTRITNKKALTAWNIMLMRKLPMRPVMAADTAVVFDGVIYGKPAGRDEAHAMLSRLSGQTHQVLTGITLVFHEYQKQVTQTSEVTFRTLSPKQIDHYCSSAEPLDKAGGYGIQGSAARFISTISGSYSGIMGLPLIETADLLWRFGIASNWGSCD